MKKILLLLTIAISSTACADNGEKQAQNKVATTEHHVEGKILHEEKCTQCHKNEVYTREDRMVKTMSALENQVNNCMKGAAKAEWTQPQTTSVIEFLNDRYYKF